jgi:hypothetical protein
MSESKVAKMVELQQKMTLMFACGGAGSSPANFVTIPTKLIMTTVHHVAIGVVTPTQ